MAEGEARVYEPEGLCVVDTSMMTGEKHGCVFCGEQNAATS
ncbi:MULTISPECIES: hypothetical protein [Escherichia]|nr:MULTISPECIES: hypothetical protein [Escherichia]MEC9497066.1 hypothetical protein [Escherichia whittamii]MEC9560737.1 hypothetical protein [Escherichia whittamii]